MYVCYFLCLCVNNSFNSTLFFDIFQKHAKERYVLKMLSVLEINVFAGEDTMELEIRKEILLNAEVWHSIIGVRQLLTNLLIVVMYNWVVKKKLWYSKIFECLTLFSLSRNRLIIQLQISEYALNLIADEDIYESLVTFILFYINLVT